MRQGQQHRRGRSRGSSSGGSSNGGNHSQQHRKGQNPLARSFESNGPDVKVRGTAADVAAKYIMLARDAHSSGDPVLAESYLQHAEHYNRMIIAYREQQMLQGGDPANGNGQRHRNAHDMGDGSDEGEGDAADPGTGDHPSVPTYARHPGQDTQPQTRNEPRHEQRHEPRLENGRHDGRPEGRQEARPDARQETRQDERRGEQGRQHGNRSERGDNPRFRDRRFERPDYRSDRQDRGERRDTTDEQAQGRDPQVADAPQPAIEAGEPPAREPAVRESAASRRERGDMMKDQPEFLRRPVRRPRREEAAPEAEAPDSGKQRQEEPGA
jgi:hypothetical protein